jgi:hypothetical protein
MAADPTYATAHASTRRDASYRASCFNKPRERTGYWARNRIVTNEEKYEYEMVWVEDKMSALCRQIDSLPECTGCSAPKDTEYITRMSAASN